MSYTNVLYFNGHFFSVLHQATISPQRPQIAIHTTFISVTSGLKATVHGQYTFIVLVGISLFSHIFVLTNIYIYYLLLLFIYNIYAIVIILTIEEHNITLCFM